MHVLDIVENAIQAGARHVDLRITEDLDRDSLNIAIVDDGSGMDVETLHRVRDPFFTTRTTRHVGMGIPLLVAAAERCAGQVTIDSVPGQGTAVEVTFQHSHIDRAPLGDIAGTLMCILVSDRQVELCYEHRIVRRGAERTFELDTQEINQVLGDVPLSFPEVRRWLSAFIVQGEQQLKES